MMSHGPKPQVNKDTLSGRIFQEFRCYLPGVGQGLNLSLECAGFGQPRPAKLILYYTIAMIKMMMRNSGLIAAATDTNETGHRHSSEAEI